MMWSIVDHAWLSVIGDPERAGHALVTLSVPDLDLAVKGLHDREPKVDQSRSWGRPVAELHSATPRVLRSTSWR
jgi:hypothetical protein